LIWFLIFVAVAISGAILVWDYRRKIAARESASKKRFEEMFMVRQAPVAGAAPPAATSAAMVPVVHAASASAMPKGPAPAAAASSPRFLGQPETLVYRLLRASIPDHEVFANVSLASVVGVSGNGFDREQQLRRLSQYRLDFVMCDKSMRVVAVVEIEPAGGMPAAGDRQFKADSLKAAGIKLIRVSTAKLPRREELHALVCGGGQSGGSVAPQAGKSG
jgi:hypothetical protein